tara:strand:- start:805 stop:1626 length:822 start_codon:yes stop_codon:yes gene_type:complete
MSRILKRPMFRKGGSTNEGIMHGLVDRKGYANGTYKERALEALRTDAPRDTSMYEMLIGGGLNLVSGAGAGEGLMANVARSYKGPSEEYFKTQRAARDYDRKLEQTAGQIGLEQEFAMEQIGAKSNPQSTLFNRYLDQAVDAGMSGPVATRFATYRATMEEDLRQKVGGNRLGGIIEFDLNDEKQKRKQLPKMKKDIGKYFYDPYDGKIKQLVEQNGVLGFLEFDSVDSIDFSAVPGTSTETSTPYQDEQKAIEQEKSEGILTEEDIRDYKLV